MSSLVLPLLVGSLGVESESRAMEEVLDRGDMGSRPRSSSSLPVERCCGDPAPSYICQGGAGERGQGGAV